VSGRKRRSRWDRICQSQELCCELAEGFDEVILKLVGLVEHLPASSSLFAATQKASAKFAALREDISGIVGMARENSFRTANRVPGSVSGNAPSSAVERQDTMTPATLTISSKNYSSWSLRGWLLCKMAGLRFDEQRVDIDDPDTRQELLLLSPSVLVPRLTHNDVVVWDTLAIAGYLHEIFPEAGLLPTEITARAHCRAVSGEMHGGFYNLRSALPMNLKAQHKSFKIFTGARPDVERIKSIWTECLERYNGTYLFGDKPTLADAMYAPVCSRFRTYAVPLEGSLAAYSQRILDWPLMKEWTADALAEPDEMIELEVEF